MSITAHRVFKNHLYALFARIGKALSKIVEPIVGTHSDRFALSWWT